MAKLFFSYSHRDESLRDELEIHLAMLNRQGLIDAWHDRRIAGGDELNGQISQHLESADVILLLVSPYFLASNYCYDIEMRRAMERHDKGEARVIPVILEPCDWHSAPFGKLLALPKDGKPISKYPNPHDAFLEVIQGIRVAIGQRISSREKEGSVPIKPNLRESGFSSRSSNLRLKKTFTDDERDTFREESFEYMANFFEGSLAELQNRNEGITYKFRRLSPNHFTAIIYLQGRSIAQCGVRHGGGVMGNSIVFSSDPSSTNSWNASLSIEDDGHTLYLQPMGYYGFTGGQEKGILSQEGASEFFWSMLIEPLQR